MNNLTTPCKSLMCFINDNKIINHSKKTKKTDNIFIEIYNNIIEGNEHLQCKKTSNMGEFYVLKITKILNVNHIPRPKLFNNDDFPKDVRIHIDENISYSLHYTFSLLDREIDIHFLVEDVNLEKSLKKYNKYVERIYIWLYMINKYTTKKCSKKLRIFIYSTSLTKKIPRTNIEVLDQIHVNTAFTYSCIENSNEIVIFRKEEWFKVLLHESFHNFDLDFSNMNNTLCNERILSIYKVNSKVNLYEAYTEFWAEIMNVCFCSFFILGKEVNINSYKELCYNLVDVERTYSIFQLCKTLDFMGLTYKNLYLNDNVSKMARETLYKEKTNVLSYYIITAVLMNNYSQFFEWCRIHNNISLIKFDRTTNNLKELCDYIEKSYKTPQLIHDIEYMEKFLNKYQNSSKKINDKKFILNNMRMSVCEMV